MNSHASPRLARVRALGAHRLRLIWTDGPEVVVDLSNDVARLKSLASLRNDAEWRRATLSAGGHAVVWPSGVDIGADTLWRDTLLALDKADTVAFMDWRMEHGLSLAAAAEALGLSRRMVAYYSSGEKPVPKTVLLACRGWAADRQAA